jgi:hypothetical protein
LRSLLILSALVAQALEAQTNQDLLLPQFRLLSGVVTDQQGNPVAGARFDHLDELAKSRYVDAEGKFEFYTKGAALVLRKVGFNSVFLEAREARDLTIVLTPAVSRAFPTCLSKAGESVSLQGWSALFVFPRGQGVDASPESDDSGYGKRLYYVSTRDGDRAIEHGSDGGPSSRLGIPTDGDVWLSTEYHETIYNNGILSAQGRLGNGNRWRYLGRFGESASYSDVDDATAEILDKVLDGACIRFSSTRLRDLSQYDAIGPFDLPFHSRDTSQVHARIREFLWTHWKQQKKGE